MRETNKKISLALLIALVGFPQMSETIYTPSLPAVTEGLKASAHLVEATLAIYFIGFALGVTLWGALSDLWGRRPMMLVGLLIYGLGSLACANAASVESLLVWRCIQAFGASVGSVITQTMLRDLYEGSRRAQLFAIIGGALAFSPAIGPVLGGFLSEICGWRSNFWILVGIAGVLMVWSILCLPETRAETIKKPTINQFRELLFKMLTSKVLWGHILLIGSTNGILFSFYEEAPFLFVDHLGLRPSQYGLLGVLIAIATIIAAKLTYRLSKSVTAEVLIRYGAWISVTGSGVFVLTMIMKFFFLQFICLALSVLSLMVIFIGIGLIIPNSLSIAMKPYQAVVGIAGSIFGGCYYCLIAGYTWMMSLFHNESALPLPIYLLAIACVLVLSSYLVNQRQESTAFQHASGNS